METIIKEELSKLGEIKTLIRGILMPLTIRIESEDKNYHLMVDGGGAVSLFSGLCGHPDITIFGKLDELAYLMRTRDKNKFISDSKAGNLRVSPHTFKGLLAVAKLMETFLAEQRHPN